MRQQISTYLIHINKEFLTIDTRFFTVSIIYLLPDCVSWQNPSPSSVGGHFLHPLSGKYMQEVLR